VKSFLVQDMHN